MFHFYSEQFSLLHLVSSDCMAAVKGCPVLQRCVVIFVVLKSLIVCCFDLKILFRSGALGVSAVALYYHR